MLIDDDIVCEEKRLRLVCVCLILVALVVPKRLIIYTIRYLDGFG